ncbi:hypothetical protein OVY01_08230 [Robbsia sp. Bb-Pol-6]|uniref:Uncharacterized protein n=2 Tax=Robbsia betulipollinis TaxID=2981849 RepID=A0ABT3ZL06_9BURK|nr:hypothetical protein [Robbsia betulipollinis]
MAMTSCTTASAGAAVAMGFWPMTGGPALKAGGAMGSDRVERDSLDGEANDTAGVTVRRGESTDAVRLVRRTGRYGCHFDRRPEALARGAVQSRRVASGVADTARGGDAYAPDAGPAAGAARRPSISVPDSTGSASPGACGAYGDWPATPWRLYFTFRSWEHKPVIELSSTPGIFTPNARPAVLTVHVTTVDRAALRAIKGALARGDADADAELAIVAVEA